MSLLLNDYLDHILNEIHFINSVMEETTHEEFLEDDKTKRAIIRSFVIDYDIVWDVISNKLQALQDTIESIRHDVKSEE